MSDSLGMRKGGQIYFHSIRFLGNNRNLCHQQKQLADCGRAAQYGAAALGQ
ncbi:MAG: hypothetical protein ACJAZ0_001320 [Halioglobus sp.]|jgi:hypothetical protein